MHQTIPFRQVGFIIITLAVLQLMIQASLLTRGVEYAAVSLIVDDTYYYLQTAWNAKLLGFVTFDGLHSTNGVQLLWFAIIFLLALLVKTKAVLLFATLAVSFLLNALCYLVILKIAAVVKQPVLALFLASLWALQSLPFRIYSMGMENSLHALVFWCVIWQGIVFLLRIQTKEKPNFRGLTVVLILLVWTRLDSALIATLLFTFCVGMLAQTYRNNFRLFLKLHVKDIAGAGLLAGLGLSAQLIAFRLMGDSFLPISALIKTSGGVGGSDIAPIDKLAQVIVLGMPSILQGRFPTLALILFGIFGVLVVILASVNMRECPPETRVLLNLWSCLLVGEIGYYVSVALSSAEYTPYFIWYRSPSFIFWIITGSLIALFAWGRAGLAKKTGGALKLAPVGFSLVVFVLATYLFARSINFTSNLYVARYKAAQWIAQNSPPETVFAAWNAGQLSFFSNRTFINLDGLINDSDYYERVLRGSVPLSDYLAENKVAYIVDYSIYHPLPVYPVVHTFPLHDETGRSIQIWEVSPHLSSAP